MADIICGEANILDGMAGILKGETSHNSVREKNKFLQNMSKFPVCGPIFKKLETNMTPTLLNT